VDADDLALLRRFEPIVKYTRGEEFLPTRVDDYVASCSLWREHADGRKELLVPRWQVTIETLARPWPVEPGGRLSLQFIEPLTIAQLTRELLKSGGPHLREPSNRFLPDISRLARVGYLSRIADALFSLSLLLRGRVSADAAAAAVLEGRKLRARDDRCSCSGRLVRQMAGSSSSTGSSPTSTTGALASSAPTTTKPTGRWSPSTATRRPLARSSPPRQRMPRTTTMAMSCAAAGMTPTSSR
jgi:hypothetical protein